ncbi:MAG: division/cell wall cluster transcriptional repressor MraZ [Planctomycetaceae bacterium]|nr:division/cell wall cluster transcriptional repressor MraZ [Planctomycetaceae bacterium]
MNPSPNLILGEFTRALDDRFRLSLPPELTETLQSDSQEVILAKERPGCLSLWNVRDWQSKWDAGVQLLNAKLQAGKLEGRMVETQLLGRLLSSRQRTVQLAQRGRLLIPEGFREFLRVEAGGEVMVIGAAVCVEIWNPRAWLRHLDRRMPRFTRLFDELSK